MPIEPRVTTPKVIKQGALLFPLTMFSATLTAALFAHSWHEPGMRPLLTGLLMSFVVTAHGQMLRHHFRARSLMAGVPERASVRVTAFALLCVGVAMTVATVWRGFN